MGMRIYTNINAIDADRHLGITSNQLSKAIQKLSSGLRINSAADDAAGLAISERLNAQVRGNNMAVRNAQDGLSLFQTAEGALDEVHSMLQRMRELTVQAANGTLNTSDKESISAELEQLTDAIDRVTNTTQFNGLILMNGTFNGSTPGGAQNPLTLQIGPNANTVLAAQGNTPISYNIAVTMRVLTSGAGPNAAYNALGQTVSVGGVPTYRTISQVAWQGAASAAAAAANFTPTQANSDLAVIDGAIDAVSSFRGELGAKFNSMEHTIASLNVASENQAAAESRIRDLDVANQTVEFTKLQILQQAGTAVLAQANTSPQTVLQLLK